MRKPNTFSLSGRALASVNAAVLGLALGGAGAASAGFITTHAAGLDAIFSQAGFGGQTIDTSFNAGLNVANTALLSIDTDAEFDALFSLSVYSGRNSKTINMIFVDAINFCGAAGSYIGCGNTPGNLLVVSSSFAARADVGANLEAHELGHNLGLDHVNGSGSNLMNPSISSNFSLDAAQIQAILASSLVQTASNGQRFLSITPIAIVASVPETQTWAMFALGLFGVMAWARRRGVRVV
ncbi:MAG: hypothetical protein H7274_17040 [Rhodoferax sp.]|nr:hypothetical protein [Rhodoferax sp.]